MVVTINVELKRLFLKVGYTYDNYISLIIMMMQVSNILSSRVVNSLKSWRPSVVPKRFVA